jgi:hypothetical protein
MSEQIPLINHAPEGEFEQRRVEPLLPGPMHRRGFLRAVGLGAMALGVAVLGTIPPARRAEAAVGTEYYSCSAAGYSYDNKICTPKVYSPYYCGSDKWFKNGCFKAPDNYTDCYSPTKACGGGPRNAWRWGSYRCADGYYKPYGGGSYFKICNAKL